MEKKDDGAVKTVLPNKKVFFKKIEFNQYQTLTFDHYLIIF